MGQIYKAIHLWLMVLMDQSNRNYLLDIGMLIMCK